MPEPDAYNYCALPLAAYACRPDLSRGRLHAEADSRYRTGFQRDRDRVIHSQAFRRLKYKTQVFIYHEDDNYRTRLTHTLEVAQIARTLARALMANEDLAEAIALAHDLGHTPFAHVGEDALNACMEEFGGFDHNDQSLRVLTVLERKYPGYEGLNLSWETLEGIAKHNGPLTGPRALKQKRLPETVAALQAQTDLQLDTFATVEAQVAALADDIAYNSHDIEDGLGAGLFTLADLADVDLLREQRVDALRQHGVLPDDIVISIVIRQAIGAMVEDVLAETQGRLKNLGARDPNDVRAAAAPVVAFSEGMGLKVQELRNFLWERMYRHQRVARMRLKVSRIVRDLYGQYMDDPRLLPDQWHARLVAADGVQDRRKRARLVADCIAGMTDRSAMREHEKLFDLYRELR